MRITLKNKELRQLLKEYHPYLTRRDLPRIVERLLESEEKDLRLIAESYLLEKFSIEKITDLVERKGEVTHRELITVLGLSKSRFYRHLNFLKRYHIQRNVGIILERGRLRRNPVRKKKLYVKKLLNLKKGKRYILLNPGPVLTTPTVKEAMIQYDLCHRDPDFSALLNRLKKNALKVFRVDNSYRVLFISGSGTSTMEAMLTSIIPLKGRTLVLSNGAFGERLAEILTLHTMPQKHLRWGWGERIDVAKVERVLQKDPRITTIVMNHHETSVGLLNPITEVGKLAKKYKKLFLVDAISSLGGEHFDVKESNIDACCTSGNKCLHGMTGVGMVCVKHSLLKKLAKQPPRSYYLNLYRHYHYLETKNQTPFTPNVTALFALDQAVKELLEEGLEVRRKKYVRLNALLKSGLQNLGFDFFTNYGTESHTILTVKVPKGIPFPKFYEEVKKEGFLIYACKPPLAGKYFQVANMGAVNEAMIYDFLFIVEKVLKKLKR